jgi:hypothetical protein
MVQFYFLSVILNLIGGYALTIADRSKPHVLLRNLDTALSSPRVRLALGVLSLLTGIFKFITPMRGDVRVIGDLFPAVSGLLVGAVLLLELRRSPDDPFVDPASREGEAATPEKDEAAPPAPHDRFAERLLKSGRKIGYVAMLVGLAHFLFPMELFF